MLDGRRVNGCLALAVAHQDAQIVTIEGLAVDGDHLHPLQRSFIEHSTLQCGSVPGQLLLGAGYATRGRSWLASAVSGDLTAEHITLDDEEISEHMSGNLALRSLCQHRPGNQGGHTEGAAQKNSS